ncbi:MAG: hypothetical protein GY765_10785, partial [bacterium]|nr:hypothetical protein [bacterium]
MAGLDLIKGLPAATSQFPTIVFSIDKIEKSICGLASRVVIKDEITEAVQVVKRDRIEGQMIFQIWIRRNVADLITEIERGVELLINFLETNGNSLRVNGVLKNKLSSIGALESSEKQDVWLINGQPGQALGKRLVYNFVYEDMEGEAEDDFVIREIVVEPIKVDETIVPENASVPPDA